MGSMRQFVDLKFATSGTARSRKFVCILLLTFALVSLAQCQISFYQTPFNQNAAGVVFQADFNGDGKLDLIDLHGLVLLGNGDGTFTTGTTASLPSGTTNIAIGDFNGDGKQDILAINGFNLSVSSRQWRWDISSAEEYVHWAFLQLLSDYGHAQRRQAGHRGSERYKRRGVPGQWRRNIHDRWTIPHRG